MRALTIWQPYASLVMTGTKTIETRSRPTHIRGTIAIHAAKVKKSPYQLGYTPLETLKLHETLQPYCNLGHSMFELPHGMMLGTAELVDCFKIVEAYVNTAILENGRQISGDEFLFGDYRAGRYAWILKKPQPFETPVPAKGGQGWWNWQKPEDGVHTIKKLSQEEAHKLLESSGGGKEYTPYGLFYIIDEDKLFTGIDNTTGNAWTDDFNDINKCFDWLNHKYKVQ